MKEKILRFKLPLVGSPFDVYERFFPGGRTLLNRTEWRGKEPRSCGVTDVRIHDKVIHVKVSYRPKGCITYVGNTKYDGWTAMMVDKQRDGTLLDGHGQPLKDGEPPVYLAFEMHKDTEFKDIEFGEFVGEFEAEGVRHVTHEQVMADLQSARSVNASVRADFVAPRRSRPNAKIILSNSPTGEFIDGFHTRILNINNDTPHLEQVLMDRLTELMTGFLEGKVSVKNIATDDFCYVELSDSLVDCTPNEHGMDSWFDVINTYVKTGFFDELAKRLMAEFAVDVTVVDGKERGLVLKRVRAGIWARDPFEDRE